MKSLSKHEDKLTQDEIKSIRKAVDELGARAVAETLRISRLALSNATSEFPVTRGTISLIRANWERLDV